MADGCVENLAGSDVAYRPKGWEGQTLMALLMSMVIMSSRICWSWAILAGRSPLVELRGEDMGEAAAEAVVILVERLKEDMVVVVCCCFGECVWVVGVLGFGFGFVCLGVWLWLCLVVRKEEEEKRERRKCVDIYICLIRSQTAHYLGFFTKRLPRQDKEVSVGGQSTDVYRTKHGDIGLAVPVIASPLWVLWINDNVNLQQNEEIAENFFFFLVSKLSQQAKISTVNSSAITHVDIPN